MKKHILTLYCLLLALQGYAQSPELAQKIREVEKKVQSSPQAEKLIWLDSLSTLALRLTDYEYDVLARRTLDKAMALDSTNIFAKNLSKYIYHKTNVDGVPGEGLKIYDEYAPQLKKLSSKKWLAKIYIEHGFSHFISGNIDSSFYYYDKTVEFSKLANDTFTLADAKVCLGEAYAKQGDFTKASQNLKESASYFRKLKDTSKILYVQKNIILLYRQSGFYKESEQELQEALALSTAFNEYNRIAVFNFFASEEYQRRGEEKERIAYLKKAITNSYKSTYDLFNRLRFLSALSIAYSENDSIAKAQEVLKKIEGEQKIRSKELNLRNRIYYVDALKKLAEARGNYNEALHYGKESLQINIARKAFEETEAANYFLSKAYEAIGDQDNALKFYKSYAQIKDSITGIHKTRTLAHYQTLYETEKRDLEILSQKSNISLLEQKHKIRNQWFIIGGILALLFFIIFFLRSRYQQKLQRGLAVEKLRTQISSDLHDDVGSLLTGLAMHSEILGKNAPDDIKLKLNRVSELSRSAMLKMRDSVWVMDARKDNWQSLIDRINEFASEHLGTKELSYNLNPSNLSNEEEIEGLTRQHLYLVAKEAIANIIKHSNANEVVIDMAKKKDLIELSIKDNGAVTKQTSAGMGLSNMKQRIASLNGKFEVSTSNGFAISIRVPA